MCGIFGCIPKTEKIKANTLPFRDVIEDSAARGRDGWGVGGVCNGEFIWVGENNCFAKMKSMPGCHTLIGNTRAEPTTEHIKNKKLLDQQPYVCGDWMIVHNGTIANDKKLRTGELPTTIDSAAIAEHLNKQTHNCVNSCIDAFELAVRDFCGSFAILAINKLYPGVIFAACNYRPIWTSVSPEGDIYFASSERALRAARGIPQLIQPYSVEAFNYLGRISTRSLLPLPNKKALIVCSGGLDSTVAATKMKREGYNIELVHFLYGSRPQEREGLAIEQIAKALNVPHRFVPLPMWRPQDSPLMRADSTIAGGEQGAEFAHEWVPARNLVMLAVATAIAEAENFNTIVLGNNLEEAGAYPDNEPEFINRLNEVMPFAVGANKQVKIMMPVGNLMKHEIVAEGLRLNAPMDLTWSCYRNGQTHCGRCGPCHMRRIAFQMNNATDPISYED